MVPLGHQSRRIHELMCLMAIIIFPLFAFFDKYTTPPDNYWFLTKLRLGITAIIIIWLIIQKKYKTPEIYLTYFSFCAVSWFCALGCVLGSAEYLYQHNIAYCTVFLAASLFILWPWYHSLFVVLSSIFIYFLLDLYYQSFSIKLAMLDGGAVLLTLMVLHPVIIYFRYESYKREFLLKIELEDSNKELLKSKNETDQRYKELTIAREDLKEANEELKSVNQNLEWLVASRTQKLEETNLKLQKALNELDRLLYSSYHDIKGPIARMRGLANLLTANVATDQVAEYTSYFLQTIEEMELLIDKLNRVNSLNQRELLLKEVDILALFFHIADKYPEHKILIQTEDNLKLETDEELVRVVFDCLIDNSLKYRNLTESRPIFIRAKKSLFGIEFEVEDNGDGIPSDQIDKIFLMFYRAHAKSTGHGLGLYLAKKALEKLNGTIKVESVEAKFTKFTFYIPVENYVNSHMYRGGNQYFDIL